MTRQYLYKCGNPDCGVVNATTKYYGPLMQSMLCGVCEIAADRHCIYGYDTTMPAGQNWTPLSIVTIEDGKME
jgi:hypothetical protein